MRKKRTLKMRLYRPVLELLENRTLPSFVSSIAGAIGGHPVVPRVGDFNGDGIPDLVTIDPSRDTVSVMLGKGNGTFGNPLIYPAGVGVTSVSIADLNGDHKQDLIVADFGTTGIANSGGVSVLLGKGDGTFQPAVFYATGSQPVASIARDFNGDGNMDIALASDTVITFTTGGTVDVLLGNGKGGFAAAGHFLIGTLPNSFTAGDFNGDGKIDLAVAGSGASALSVLLGLGNGSFAGSLDYTIPAITPVSLTAGDFNQDGKTDLAMIDSTTDLVEVATSNGNGTFQVPVSYNLGPATRLLATDVTGNGFPDLITVGGDVSGIVTVAGGKGDGTFLPAVQYAAGVSQPDSLAVGAFTGNGRVGIAAISSSTGALGVLLNVVPAQVQFSAASYTVSQGVGSATITVTRTGGSGGTVTVAYATTDGSRAGTDYQATSGSLVWADGDTAAKTFTVSVLDSGQVSSKTVNLTLGTPGGDAVLGSQSTAQLILTPDHFRTDKILGEASQTGQWWLSLPGPTGVKPSLQGAWAPQTVSLHWVNVVSGDFNGDGHTDIAGMVQETGQWWVSLSTAGGFFTTPWAGWDPKVTWVDVRVGDFTGDGKDDIIARNAATGQWWCAMSTGKIFITHLWGKWSTAVTWVDVMVGDLAGNGRMDIVGRVKETGQWWVGFSTGTALVNQLWGAWAPDSAALTWVDVRLGDLDGDGKADIVGRVLQSGDWWAGLSTGIAFSTRLWGHWSSKVTWVDVMLGDVTGDGRMDLVGRVQQTGQWWVGISTGSSMNNSLWGTWSTSVTWADVQLGDFNGDGKKDIIGRPQGSGQWWLAQSSGMSFTTSLYTTWSSAVTWINVRVGTFA